MSSPMTRAAMAVHVGPPGRSTRCFHAERLADDLRLVAEAVTARLGGAAPAYLGHSLGSASALDLAIEGRLPRFTALMLIDPPVFPSARAKSHDEAARIHARLLAVTRKRRADWPSVEAFCERLKSANSVFANFPDAMLEAYAAPRSSPSPKAALPCAVRPRSNARSTRRITFPRQLEPSRARFGPARSHRRRSQPAGPRLDFAAPSPKWRRP